MSSWKDRERERHTLTVGLIIMILDPCCLLFLACSRLVAYLHQVRLLRAWAAPVKEQGQLQIALRDCLAHLSHLMELLELTGRTFAAGNKYH